MKKSNTKELILLESLELFSQKGYEGVSMRDIALAVDIKAASLYNHFKGKAEIFENLLNEMTSRYEESMSALHIPDGEPEADSMIYMNITEEALIQSASGLFLYFLKDDFAAKFRRLLTIEQFRDGAVGTTFQEFFINNCLDYNSALFSQMMQKNGFRTCNPYVMALHFYSPIFLLLSKYDSSPEKEEEALTILSEHVKQFAHIYAPV